MERYQVLDQLTLLVDKSLVVAEDTGHGTRYRLLETVRQYAQEKLREAREGDDVRTRHRDHYTAMAAVLDAPADSGYQERIEWAEAEMDNLRAAFTWSRERADDELALALASSLQPLWLTRGRVQEGLNWLSAALAGDSPQSADASAARVRASADKALLTSFTGSTEGREEAEQALAAARELGDPALVMRALTSCGALVNAYDREVAGAVLRRGDGTRAGAWRFPVVGADHRPRLDDRSRVDRTRRGSGSCRGRTADRGGHRRRFPLSSVALCAGLGAGPPRRLDRVRRPARRGGRRVHRGQRFGVGGDRVAHADMRAGLPRRCRERAGKGG